LLGLGPESVKHVLEKVDAFVGQLVDAVSEAKLELVADIVLASSPGYVDVTIDKIVHLTKIVDGASVDFVGSSPVVQANLSRVHGDQLLDVFERLKDGRNGQYEVYRRQKLPERWHVGLSDRVGDLTLVGQLGVVFQDDFYDRMRNWNKEFFRKAAVSNVYGWNGFDNKYGEMWTPLIVRGPSFKANVGRLAANATLNLTSADVFGLLCKALQLDTCNLKERNASPASVASLFLDTSAGEKIQQAVKDFTAFVQDPHNVALTSREKLFSCHVMCYPYLQSP